MIALKYLQSKAMSLEIQKAKHYDVDEELHTVYTAIKELEESENRKCESCKYLNHAPYEEPCNNCMHLQINNYKPKDKE